MSDAAPHNEGALSVPVAATIAVGAAGLPAVLAGDIALCDPPIAALRWALATAIAVGVIAALAARDRWRSGVVPASAFAGFMLGNLALVQPAVLGVVSWCARHAARRPPNADTAPDEVMLLSAASFMAIPAALLAATALSALAGWAVTPLVRGDRPPRPSVDAVRLAVTGGTQFVIYLAGILLLGAGPLAWTSIEGELLSGWTSVLGVVVFGGVVLFALAVLWATTATVGTTIHAGLLRRFTVRGGVLAVILALSLAHLAGEQLNGALQSMGLEASTEWTSTLMLLGPFALFVWLTRPRVGVRPANLATVFDAALLLAPTLTAGMAATIYGGVALSFGVVLLVNPLMEGRPPTADELGQTQQAIHLFTPGPLASLYPWLAWTCVPLLLFGLLRRRPL